MAINFAVTKYVHINSKLSRFYVMNASIMCYIGFELLVVYDSYSLASSGEYHLLHNQKLITSQRTRLHLLFN